MKKLLGISRIAIVVSALLLIITFYVPIWKIMMWAPQYPEWLHMYIWLDNITGDVNIINGLNHYIGMKHIIVDMFPEFKIMPSLMIGIISLGLIVAVIGRRVGLWAFLIVLLAAGAAGLYDFYLWSYDYGHNLDPTAAIKVPGMSYQPPLIGSKQLLNFIAYSTPDIGGWIVLTSGFIIIGTIVFEYWKNKNI